LKLEPIAKTLTTKTSADNERLILAINDFEEETDFSVEHERGTNTTMNLQTIKVNPYTAEIIKGRRRTLKPL
jgi:hypothetical protein